MALLLLFLLLILYFLDYSWMPTIKKQSSDLEQVDEEPEIQAAHFRNTSYTSLDKRQIAGYSVPVGMDPTRPPINVFEVALPVMTDKGIASDKGTTRMEYWDDAAASINLMRHRFENSFGRPYVGERSSSAGSPFSSQPVERKKNSSSAYA